MPNRARARIIVENRDNQWTAWFADSPQYFAEGESAGDALWRLLQPFENELDCNLDKIAAIDSASCDNHLEFSIPYCRLKRVPKPSVN